MEKPELLSPAGDLSKLKMALHYGADAVYVGAAGFSMRPDIASFDLNQLEKAVKITHQMDKKIYVGVNSLLMENDLSELEKWLHESKHIALDAVIVADAGAIRLVKKINPSLKMHISTQMSTANSESALFWRDIGAERVVLARECTLENAKQIHEKSGVPLEAFVHGAMCVAVSGRCLLSAYMVGKNASQGVCKHSCRWSWEVTEEKRPGETFPVIEADGKTIIFGSTDLCLIKHIPEVINSGISSLKIEGRMKGEYYVAMVTHTYRKAIDKYFENPEKYEFDPAWLEELESISHHPYATGFAFGYPSDAPDKIQTVETTKGTYDVLGIVEQVTDDNLLKITVKNQIHKIDKVEWVSPQGNGWINVNGVYSENMEEKDTVHSGTTALIKTENTETLPPLSILRRKID